MSGRLSLNALKHCSRVGVKHKGSKNAVQSNEALFLFNFYWAQSVDRWTHLNIQAEIGDTLRSLQCAKDMDLWWKSQFA